MPFYDWRSKFVSSGSNIDIMHVVEVYKSAMELQ